MKKALLFIACVSCLTARGETFLPDESRTSGAGTLKPVADVQKRAAAASVGIGDKPATAKLMGVILSPDGYILTKADETHQMKKIVVWLDQATSLEARLVHRDDKLDLALLKLERSGLSPLEWGDSTTLTPGQWLLSLMNHDRVLRLGVVSAKRRAIPNSGAVLGVRFAREEKGNDGVRIEEVAEDGPAQKAGLRADDVVISLNERNVNDPQEVKGVIGKMQPGETVKVRYKREGKDAECEVKLASRNRVMKNWSGEDFGNHGTSVRTDNYPEVIQHDMPLGPEDMGGALLDLQGRAVGLNISRVDRVTNYALPVEAFLTQVKNWMEDDRQKSPAESRPTKSGAK